MLFLKHMFKLLIAILNQLASINLRILLEPHSEIARSLERLPEKNWSVLKNNIWITC